MQAESLARLGEALPLVRYELPPFVVPELPRAEVAELAESFLG